MARVVIPDLSVHIVQRGHNRQRCFFEEADYRAYLDLLCAFAPRSACSVHAYCLMTNHVHLFITPHAADSCAQLMKNVAQRYVQRINARLKRSGTLWEDRFYSCLVTSDAYALACYRYVERNPVRPGMVSHPRDYSWSSYAANVLAQESSLLTPHSAYLAMGEDGARRAAAYGTVCDTPLAQEVIDDIRRATRRGYVVGSPRRPRGRPWPGVREKWGLSPIKRWRAPSLARG